jgi:hypothetical protein
LYSKSSSLESLSKSVLTIGDDGEDGESGYQPVNRTPYGEGAEPCGGCWYGTLAGLSLSGGRPEKLLTFGHRAPQANTNDDLADSDNGKSSCHLANRTLHGD